MSVASVPVFAQALRRTPDQILGRFIRAQTLDQDADLTPSRASRTRGGTGIHVMGRVLTVAGQTVHGARVEICRRIPWRYTHPMTLIPPADPHFEGFAVLTTDARGTTG